MSPIEKIQTEIEGLKELLVHAQRISQPKYIRQIRKDIEGLERELKIHRVRIMI